MGGVCGDVAAFVVAVEGEVEAEEVLEGFVGGSAFAEEGGEVVGPVLRWVDGGGEGAAAVVRVLVDFGGDEGEFAEQRDGVVEGGFPVVGFVEAGLVGFGEDAGVVEGGDGDGELRHGV